jgi:SAM-dependent methyltransferase
MLGTVGRDVQTENSGVVYTPPALVALLVQNALGRDPKPGLWVLDPACGQGALLSGVDTADGGHQLCGVDLDSQALAAARRCLGPGALLKRSDALSLDWAKAFPGAERQGGFDVVIGNPPYVRQEFLGEQKRYLAEAFTSFHGAADLYVYFLELGLRCLRPGGRLAFLVPNKWLSVGYAAGIRRLLAREACLERVVDFGHAPLFRGTDAFPCVVVLRRMKPVLTTMVAVSRVPRTARGTLARQVQDHQHPVPQKRWGPKSWQLESEDLHRLLEKIQERGTPLGQVLGAPIRRGVLTGLNEAFVIDDVTRDKLLTADPASAALLHPLARGRDLQRWRVRPLQKTLIAARRGVDLGPYPAIRAHLALYRDRLTPRRPGTAGPGRKPGRYGWYELQDTTAYWSVFEQPKIVHTDIAWRPAFALVRDPLVLLNTAYVWPTADLFLLGVVNSPVLWAWMWRRATHGKDEALRLIRSFIETLPIPDAGDGVRRSVEEAVAELCASPDADRVAVLERRVTTGVIRAFGLSPDDVALLARTAPKRMPPGL